MKIRKRNGDLQNLSLNKIVYRIRKVCNDKKLGKLKHIDPDLIAQKVVVRLYDEISTSEIDELTSQITISMATEHPEYGDIASRVVVSNMHKNTVECFSEVMETLYSNIDIHGNVSHLVSDKFINVVRKFKNELNFTLDFDRDYMFDYFGFKTLERSYLTKIHSSSGSTVVERPQHMFMRVAIGIHFDNLDKILETYNYMSQGYFTHATPTLFNAGTPRPQMSSCFLLSSEDSIDGIYKNITDCAKISKWAGGIGFHISGIRSKNSKIRGTNGVSSGIVPMLRVYNSTARYVNQAGKRNGSFACYIEPWHADVFEFLDLKKNHGDEEQRARDLFYALWIPDLFMKCVDEDLDWYLMCPDQCPNLNETYSEEFNSLYQKYIDEGKFIKKIKARDLWAKIVTSQTETGTPYMLYKDACNEKSNQKNLGTIKSSNLCSEIIEYTSPSETACCNLASIALPKFIKNVTKKFSLDNYDFEELHKISKIAIKNLDNVIDENYYPLPEAQYSNFKHRPIGLGIQGLADTYMKLRIPFESDEATLLNKKIFEVIEYASLEASCELAQEKGTYKTYEGSPLSKGLFQHNLWNIDESTLTLDWESLRQKILAHGVRNSLLTALMPTASTAQILGNSETMEPYQSNIFMRRTMSGEFPIINKFLVNDLMKLNLWNKIMRDELVRQNGSIQHIPGIPDDVKQLYKTVWEISQKSIINQSADRGPFIDQSQSLNLFLAEPTYRKITSMQFYAWKKGLKTGQYYLRTKAAREAVQVTLEVKQQPENPTEDCTDDVCVMCSG